MGSQEFMQEIKNYVADALRDMHTSIPGKIEAFDPGECTADVQPLGKYKKPDGELMDFPKLCNVPVWFPQAAGQKAAMAWPVKQGDECLLFFAEQALDCWRTGKETDADLRFDLTNAVAFVGLFAKPSPLVKKACDQDALIIEMGGQSIMMAQGKTTMVVDKLAIISAGNVSICAGGGISMNGTRIDLN